MIVVHSIQTSVEPDNCVNITNVKEENTAVNPGQQMSATIEKISGTEYRLPNGEIVNIGLSEQAYLTYSFNMHTRSKQKFRKIFSKIIYS